MKKIAFFMMLFCILSQNNYAIVIDHRYSQQQYIEYANQYPNIVKIETDSSFGSAIAIDSNTILTSSHTLKNKKNIRVIINQIEFNPVSIVFNKTFDVAIIKITNKLVKLEKLKFYNRDYINQEFTVVGIGKSGTGLTGAKILDFKKRAGRILCSSINKGFGEAVFDQEAPIELNACVAPGDSGGGVFKDDELAGVITYVTAKNGDNNGDSDYGDSTGFILIRDIEEWILENL